MSKSWHVDGLYQYDQKTTVWCINTIFFISCPYSTESLILPRLPDPRRHIFLTKLIYSRALLKIIYVIDCLYLRKKSQKGQKHMNKRWNIFVRTQNKDGFIIRSAVIWWREKSIKQARVWFWGEGESWQVGKFGYDIARDRLGENKSVIY